MVCPQARRSHAGSDGGNAEEGTDKLARLRVHQRSVVSTTAVATSSPPASLREIGVGRFAMTQSAIHRGPLTPHTGGRRGRGRALAKAHGLKPVPLPHLDLKPANLMLRREDDGLSVRLIDWGLARMARTIGASRGTRTATGATVLGQSVLIGTLDYAPPKRSCLILYVSRLLHTSGTRRPDRDLATHRQG